MLYIHVHVHDTTNLAVLAALLLLVELVWRRDQAQGSFQLEMVAILPKWGKN